MHRDYKQANPLERCIRWFASTAPGSWLFARLLQPLDAIVLRLTGGRRALSSIVAGLPTVWLTTTGARSGRPRTVPLVGLTTDRGVAIIASNFGQTHHPAWSHNLKAHPEASARIGRRELPVRAVVAEGERRAAIWAQAVALYPGYDTYEARASHRDIVVWVLEPVTA
jgi:deazaflavin-dependent oxidoreductase (nitroreductase family)